MRRHHGAERAGGQPSSPTACRISPSSWRVVSQAGKFRLALGATARIVNAGAVILGESAEPSEPRRVPEMRVGDFARRRITQEVPMLRPKISLPSVAAALSACVLVAATAACASYDEGAPVRFLRNASDAASCQKVADV